MQTFLPFADFAASAPVLDTRRLGKQRVEALQVLRAITRPDYGWRHHPAVKMWRGFEEALGAYAMAICGRWCRRGHSDTCESKIRIELSGLGIGRIRSQAELAAAGRLPPWLGDERLHRSLVRPSSARIPDTTGLSWPTPIRSWSTTGPTGPARELRRAFFPGLRIRRRHPG